MADTIDAIIKIRRGPDAQRRTLLLEPGEIAFSTDIDRAFIGDGIKLGGNYVGNHNSFGVAPSPYAIVKDLYYNTTSNIMYLLTSESGPDNMGNYARVSPISDTSTIIYNKGVFSINKSYFDSTSTGYLKLTGGLMYGYITLHQNPISAYHPVTKGYADTLVRVSSSILAEHINTNFVRLTGDRMSGFLELNAHPLNTYHAVTKGYADTTIRNVSAFITTSFSNKYINLSGDALTGFLTLHANPLLNLHPATKGYTDTTIRNVSASITNGFSNKYVNLSGDSLTGFLTLHANPTDNMHAATRGYVNAAVAGAAAGLGTTAASTYVKLAGDSLTGYLNLHANPTNNMHAATKTYTDTLVTTLSNFSNNNYVKLAGSTMTGSLTLNGNPTIGLHATPKQYVDTLINDVRTNLSNCVRLSGDSLTGFLTLHANPTNNMHAATRSYVDTSVAAAVAAATGIGSSAATTYVKLAGDTMTGGLTLNGNPTTNLQAAPKQYVDTSVNTLAATVESQYVKLAGGTISGSITVNTDLIVNQKTSLKNEVDFNNNIIKKFSPVVNTITVNTSYDLNPNDNGSVLIINGIGTSININVPDGLPAGFNVMLIQNTNTNVYIRSKPGSTTTVHNIDNFSAIRAQYGVANIVRIASSPDKYLLAGDLVG